MSVYTKLSPSSLMSSTTYIMTQIDPDLRNIKGTSDIVVLVDKAYLRKVPVTENMIQAGPNQSRSMRKNKGKKNKPNDIIWKQIRLSKMVPWYIDLISILVDKKGNWFTAKPTLKFTISHLSFTCCNLKRLKWNILKHNTIYRRGKLICWHTDSAYFY